MKAKRDVEHRLIADPTNGNVWYQMTTNMDHPDMDEVLFTAAGGVIDAIADSRQPENLTIDEKRAKVLEGIAHMWEMRVDSLED